jgi:2-keto-3-deoxy-L-rhamnonate aldolase RhmA
MVWKNPRVVRSPAARKVAESLLLGEGLRRKSTADWALGTFLIELPAPATLAALSLAGFDFVVLDMEHSSVDLATLETLVLAAQSAGLAALVRVPGPNDGLIGKVLDLGAHGVMVPHVDSAASASKIVAQARFTPRGRRGFSPLTRFDALAEPLAQLSRAAYVVVQVEGRSALERIGEIAAVPGVDAVFVGPYDLALSLGVEPGDPRVSAAARQAARLVPRGVALGIYIDDPAECGAWARRRFTLQCVSFDGRMLADGARSIADRARGRGRGRKSRPRTGRR